MSERDGSGGVLWFLAGVGIGVAVGLLYAPHSGEETRELLMSKAEEGRDYVSKRAREARGQAEQWAAKGKEVINTQKEQLRTAVEAGRQAYRDKTSAPAGDSENI